MAPDNEESLGDHQRAAVQAALASAFAGRRLRPASRDRLRAVAEAVWRGRSNGEITELGISGRSQIGKDIGSLFGALGLDGRLGLALWFERVIRATNAAPSQTAGYLESPRIHGDLVRWMRDLYAPLIEPLGGVLLDRGGIRYPAAMFPANGRAIDDVLPASNVSNQAIDWASLRTDPLPRRRRHGLPDDVGPDQEQGTMSGDNLCMTALAMQAGDAGKRMPRLSANVGSYGQIMDSSDAMIDEVLEVFGDQVPYTPGVTSPASLLPRLPLRNHVDKGPNPFVNGARRAAGIGISCLVAYKSADDGQPHGILGLRSSGVSTWRNVWHVFPSGMLGARYVQFGGYQSTDVRRGIFAEFAEELYDDFAVGGGGPRAHVDQNVAVVGALEGGRAELVLTGIAFDFLNLRPEICSVLLIHDPSWIERTKFVPNYEVAGRRLEHPRIDTDEAALAILVPEQTVPSGAAAFWWGVDVARQRL